MLRKVLIGLFAFFIIGYSSPARAQQVNLYCFTGVASPNGPWAPCGTANPLVIAAGPYQFTIPGASQPQLSVTTGAIVTPTVPAGTLYMVVRLRPGAASAINYCDDGLTSTTTGATGSCSQIIAGQSQAFQGAVVISNFRMIAATATTAVDIEYYK